MCVSTESDWQPTDTPSFDPISSGLTLVGAPETGDGSSWSALAARLEFETPDLPGMVPGGPVTGAGDPGDLDGRLPDYRQHGDTL